MSKQVLLNQAVLEFRGEFGSPDSITNDLEKRLQRADWNELLKPVLRGNPARIHEDDNTGPERTCRKTSKPRKSREKALSTSKSSGSITAAKLSESKRD